MFGDELTLPSHLLSHSLISPIYVWCEWACGSECERCNSTTFSTNFQINPVEVFLKILACVWRLRNKRSHSALLLFSLLMLQRQAAWAFHRFLASFLVLRTFCAAFRWKFLKVSAASCCLGIGGVRKRHSEIPLCPEFNKLSWLFAVETKFRWQLNLVRFKCFEILAVYFSGVREESVKFLCVICDYWNENTHRQIFLWESIWLYTCIIKDIDIYKCSKLHLSLHNRFVVFLEVRIDRLESINPAVMMVLIFERFVILNSDKNK